MRNPLGKLRALQPSSALVSGDDGALEFAMSAVELGFVGDDALVEASELDDVGFEAPIVRGFDCIKECSIAGSGPLKGLMDPVG